MLKNIRRSLSDLLGEDYVRSVCLSHAALTGEDPDTLASIAHEKVDFYPDTFAARQEELMDHIGQQMVPAMEDALVGAPTDAYQASQHTMAAPLSGLGAFRLSESGRLYFTGKSEHYQIPLGHSFPGYALIEKAKKLGIPNATHNNTRGFITRTLERRLIALANGTSSDDPQMENILKSHEPGVLNRVINLETGSLAVEAAFKMMLARFYSLDGKTPAVYKGRVPVFLVIADNAGGMGGNYHGTTVLTQTMRGLWPDFYEKAEAGALYKVVPVPINDADTFEKIVRTYNEPPYKTAGFAHEIILMNYGGIRLREAYLRRAYKICRETDTPILCDEIQSCAWYDGMFLFREYGLTPDFVSVGKGFPGGEYPASKILSSGAFDNLNQFGALVTNGQEELASLAYLVTIEFMKENGAQVTENGRYYHEQAEKLAQEFPDLLDKAEGEGFLTSLCFHQVEEATRFCQLMNQEYCVDISAQTYKPNCPPVALSKLPCITTKTMTDGLIRLYRKALEETRKGENKQ